MISSSFSLQLCPSFHSPSGTVTVPARSSHYLRRSRTTTLQSVSFTNKFHAHHLLTIMSKPVLVQKSVVPFAASVSILLCSGPAKAGFLSGFPGIESVPGPELPSIEFLNRFNEENQKKYAEFDARFKESPLLKKLLEQSRLNKEKNKQEILDKYCVRGAEWGVGDCSAEGLSPAERESFISILKQKAGMKD